jgi:hypothetical protein
MSNKNNNGISGLAGMGQPKSLIKNSLSVRPGGSSESSYYKTRSKRKLVPDETSEDVTTNIETKRSRGRQETNNQPLNAGAVQLEQELAWELIEGETIPHSDCHMTSLGIPLDKDARENYCMLASIHGYFGKKLYDSQEDLFNKNLYILKENKRRNLFNYYSKFRVKIIKFYFITKN